MKRLVNFLVVIIALAVSTVSAQDSEWFRIEASQIGELLEDISFRDTSEGWITSSTGNYVKKSTDGGRSWQQVTLPITFRQFYGVLAEGDEVINSCPGVKAGISVGFENDWYGEEVGALVIKADDSLTDEEVIAHCRKSLQFSKSPKVVVFSDSLPVTSTGKYQRMKVKHLFEQWKGVQFGK